MDGRRHAALGDGVRGKSWPKNTGGVDYSVPCSRRRPGCRLDLARQIRRRYCWSNIRQLLPARTRGFRTRPALLKFVRPHCRRNANECTIMTRIGIVAANSARRPRLQDCPGAHTWKNGHVERVASASNSGPEHRCDEGVGRRQFPRDPETSPSRCEPQAPQALIGSSVPLNAPREHSAAAIEAAGRMRPL